MSNRPIAGTIQAVRQTEGGGFVVRRPFPTARVDNLDTPTAVSKPSRT